MLRSGFVTCLASRMLRVTIMRTRSRALPLVSFAILLAVVSVIAVVFEGGPRSTLVINGDRLANALAQYTKDCRSRGEVLPPTIDLETLVSSGYLRPEDTKPLGGVQLVFHTDAVDTNPQMLLVEARIPDGQMQAVLADGSVQQFSRSRWAELCKNVGQK
jgi:hypothetical protein